MDIRNQSKKLTEKERFLNVMHYKNVDRITHREFGYWDELKEDWYNKGYLPKDFMQNNGHIPDEKVEMFFGCEQRIDVGVNVWLTNVTKSPEVIEEKGGKRKIRDPLGIIFEEIKDGTRTIPHFLDFPIKDRKTWKVFRDEFLRIDDPVRKISQVELDKLAATVKNTDKLVGTHFGSFVGWIRDMMGFENIAMLSFEDPELFEEMVAHLTEIKMKCFPQILNSGIKLDYAEGWEDICFNSGPLLNPKVFKERVAPHIKRVMDLFRKQGIDVIWTDCDGKIDDLIPYFMEAGINCMFPFEVNASNDPVEYRKRFGKELLIMGGFNKMKLLESKDAVLAEFKRLDPLLSQGGFIPHIDHRCPAGVSFEMYQYYIKEKCYFLGMPKEEIEKIEGLRK